MTIIIFETREDYFLTNLSQWKKGVHEKLRATKRQR
jgi:hypothetical protein